MKKKIQKGSWKLFSIALSLLVIAAITLVTVVSVMSATVQNIGSPMSISYHANNVSATLRATYQVAGSNSATSLTNSSNNTDYVRFTPSQTTSTGVLNAGNLTVNSTNTFILFTFAFTNDASAGAYDIRVTLTDNCTKSNMSVYYSATGSDMSGTLVEKHSTMTSSSSYTTIPSPLYIPAQSTGYFHILAEVTDLDYSASYASTTLSGLSWQLDHVDLINGFRPDGWVVNEDHVATGYGGSATSITIPSDATAINSGLFAENKTLTSVVIPNTITNIGDRAFYNCTNITSMNIQCPANTTLGSYALFGVDVDAITIANRNILKLTHLAIGHYPQTYVGNTLNTTLEGLYNGGTPQAGLTATGKSYTTSVLNSSSSSATQVYTTLPEYTYNGNKYARLSPAVTTTNNGFSTGDSITSGNTYWFKVEPISVMVMSTTSSTDSTKLTVMSDFALGSHRYDATKTLWSDTPELRTFLNGGTIAGTSVGFYAEALGDVSRVVQTTIKNQSAGSNASTGQGENTGTSTSDYVWAPSYWELTQSSNGFTRSDSMYDAARHRQATDLAKATYSYADTSSSYLGNSYYWTRSPYSSSNVYRVLYPGYFSNSRYNATTGFLSCFALNF